MLVDKKTRAGCGSLLGRECEVSELAPKRLALGGLCHVFVG